MERRALYAAGAAALAGLAVEQGQAAAQSPPGPLPVVRCGFLQTQATFPLVWARLRDIVRIAGTATSAGYLVELTRTATNSPYPPDQLLAACQAAQITPRGAAAKKAPTPTPVPGAPATRCGYVQAAPGGDWVATDQVVSLTLTASGGTVVVLRGGDANDTFTSPYTPDQWLAVLCS